MEEVVNMKDIPIGRLLRNIAFSGKGLVSNPANPRSVILNDVNPFEETQAEEISNSSINMENKDMSDVLKEQVEELKAELVTAKEAAKALETEMTKQKEEEIQSKIEAFEATVSEKDEAIAEAQAAVEAAEAKVAELQEAIAKKDEELAEALAKIEAHEAEVKAMARRAALVEAGAEEEEVEAILESFAEATDEMFEQVVALKKNALKKDGC
jgi:chromosome segregation ATPase